MSKSLADQTKTLANYVPEGDAFGAKTILGTVTHGFLEGLAGEIVRSDALVAEFRDEILPDETVLFLDEWESAVGIPDDCFKGSGTDDERRKDILTKLSLLGAQTLSDFLAIANRYDVTANITGGSVHGVFPLKFPIVFFPSAKVARFTIVVDLDDPLTPTFPLPFPIEFGGPNGPLVQCLFERMKPANVDVIFVNL